MPLTLPESSLVDYLNEACAADNFFNALAVSLDPTIQSILSQIPANITIGNITAVPENILDFIASYHYNVDGYDTTLPLISKQNLVINVIQNKLIKGTAQAIINVINLTLNYAELVEWWQTTPPGEPYTFYINLTGTPTEAQLATATANVLKLKNVRSYFGGFRGFDYNVPATPVTIGAGFVEYDYFVMGNTGLVTAYPDDPTG
jgi:phage tail P2-like protein